MISKMDNHFRLFVDDIIGGGGKMGYRDSRLYLCVRKNKVPSQSNLLYVNSLDDAY
jgi:hypothetical protein